jgi:hypothetical protein
MLMRDLRDGGDVQHVEPRVAERFAKQQARIGAQRRAPGVEVAGLHEGSLNAEAAQRVVEQIVRAAIERRRRNNMRARAHQRGNGQMQRGLAARGADRARAAFQRRDALLEHRDCGVRDARVDVARALHIEERGGVVGVAERKRRGLIDRRRACAGNGVGRGAGMQRECVETGIGHSGSTAGANRRRVKGAGIVSPATRSAMRLRCRQSLGQRPETLAGRGAARIDTWPSGITRMADAASHKSARPCASSRADRRFQGRGASFGPLSRGFSFDGLSARIETGRYLFSISPIRPAFPGDTSCV